MGLSADLAAHVPGSAPGADLASSLPPVPLPSRDQAFPELSNAEPFVSPFTRKIRFSEGMKANLCFSTKLDLLAALKTSANCLFCTQSTRDENQLHRDRNQGSLSVPRDRRVPEKSRISATWGRGALLNGNGSEPWSKATDCTVPKASAAAARPEMSPARKRRAAPGRERGPKDEDSEHKTHVTLNLKQ